MIGCSGSGHERVRVEAKGDGAGVVMALWYGGDDG